MGEIVLAHTGQLAAADLRAARALLFDVFEDMTEADWEHCLGGVHAIAREGGVVVGHASVIMRRLIHGERALRTGYVEGVAVRTDHQGRGLGAALMIPLERLIRDVYDLGALGASDLAASFYAHRGWQPWQGPTFALTPTGVRRTQSEDDCIFVLPGTTPLDLTGVLTCDWRDGDVW